MPPVKGLESGAVGGLGHAAFAGRGGGKYFCEAFAIMEVVPAWSSVGLLDTASTCSKRTGRPVLGLLK